MQGSAVKGDIRISAQKDLGRLLDVSETWKGSLHRQQSGAKRRVGVRGQKQPENGLSRPGHSETPLLAVCLDQ